MNLRNLLISAAALAAAPVFATTYYVTPEGAGTKDGSSWENAFDVEAFRLKAEENANGDIYNFAGGVYKPSATIVFKTATGATLNGNIDGERTIFSGDKNGNNNPENGDMSRLIRFQTNTLNGDSQKAVIINNIDFTCVFTNTNNASDTMGALMIDNCGDTQVNDCNFYANWSDGQQGGAAAHLFRSTVKFKNCIFRNNSANYRGGALRLRSQIDEPAKQKGFTTFENCVFKNNTNYHSMGGAICVQHAVAVNIINTTIYGNKSAEQGAAIYIGGKDTTYARALNIINSTIAGNTTSSDKLNSQIYSTQSANIRTVNSIIVSNEEKTADLYFSGDTPDDKFSFVSGGYNYVGSVVDEAAPATEEAPAVRAETETKINWQDSDNFGADCTYASIFGENKLNSDNVIVPVKYVAGATNAQLTSAVSTWNLPAGIDLTTDLNGKTRPDGSMPGSFAITKSEIPSVPTSVINTIGTSDETMCLVKTGNGVYTVEGATEGITVYTVNGATVAATSGNTVDISSFANGLYILKSGNKIFKVLK